MRAPALWSCRELFAIAARSSAFLRPAKAQRFFMARITPPDSPAPAGWERETIPFQMASSPEFRFDELVEFRHSRPESRPTASAARMPSVGRNSRVTPPDKVPLASVCQMSPRLCCAARRNRMVDSRQQSRSISVSKRHFSSARLHIGARLCSGFHRSLSTIPFGRCWETPPLRSRATDSRERADAVSAQR